VGASAQSLSCPHTVLRPHIMQHKQYHSMPHPLAWVPRQRHPGTAEYTTTHNTTSRSELLATAHPCTGAQAAPAAAELCPAGASALLLSCPHMHQPSGALAPSALRDRLPADACMSHWLPAGLQGKEDDGKGKQGAQYVVSGKVALTSPGREPVRQQPLV
jgi:hypothetical protein